MTALANVIDNVPSEYVLDVPYKNRKDLFNAVYFKIWDAQNLIAELDEQQECYQNTGKDSLEKISGILFKFDFDFDKLFSASWAYICAVEGSCENPYYVADYFKRGCFGGLNYRAAVYWLTRAANNGNSLEAYWACQDLAELYDKGLGFCVDPVAANYWHSKSAVLKAALNI